MILTPTNIFNGGGFVVLLFGIIGMYKNLSTRIEQKQTKDSCSTTQKLVKSEIESGFSQVNLQLKSLKEVLDLRLKAVENGMTHHTEYHK